MNSFSELMSASQAMVHRKGVFVIYDDGKWTPLPVPAHIAEDGNSDEGFLGIGAVGDKVYVWRRAPADTVSHIFVYHSGEWTELDTLQEPDAESNSDQAVGVSVFMRECAVGDDRLYSLTVGAALDGIGGSPLRYIRV